MINDIDLSDGGFPESTSSDLGCHEPSLSAFTPAASTLTRSANSSSHSHAGSRQPSLDANFPWHVEMLGTYLYNAARATDKKALFLEKIAGLVTRGDLVVSTSFRVPEAQVLALSDPSPRPTKPTAGTLFVGTDVSFMYNTSLPDMVVINSSEPTRLECVSSKLYTVTGRTRLAASGGPVELTSSSNLMTHSLKTTCAAHLAVLSLRPAHATQQFAVALPLAGSCLDLSSSSWPLSPPFTGSLSFPLVFTVATPVSFRLQLLRDTQPESDSQSGSQSNSPSTHHTNVTDTSAPTIVQLQVQGKHLVHISPDIEGVAALRAIDNAVLLFIIPGVYHYPGQHMRLPRIVTAQVPAQPEAIASRQALPRRRTKRSAAEYAAVSQSSVPATMSLVEQVQQAVLANDDRSFSSLLLTAPSTTEVLQARNRFGETVLHLAAAAGNTHMVNLCCTHRADPLARDYSGLTALQLAEQQHSINSKAVVRILKSNTSVADLYTQEDKKEAFVRPQEPSRSAPKLVRVPLKVLGNATSSVTNRTVPVAADLAHLRATPSVQPTQSAPSCPPVVKIVGVESSIQLKRKPENVVTVDAVSKPSQPAKKPAVRATKRSGAARSARAAPPEQEPPAVDWLALPPHLLVYIITLVPYDDVYAIMQACRALRHLASPWRVKELRIRPEATWPSQEITAKMREILVNWLVDVQQHYSLHRNTLFLAVSYIDRVLCCTPLSKRDLQLLGATCMWIAAKNEELMAPSLSDFAYICDKTYRSTEFADMESRVLRKLNFELAGVTIAHFATEYLAELAITRGDLVQLVYFFTELALSDHTLAVSTPSCVTTAILLLVTAHFLPAAECLVTQSRLRVISGYDFMDPEVRKSMHRLAAFFARPPASGSLSSQASGSLRSQASSSLRSQSIFDKYAREQPEVTHLAQCQEYNV